MDQAIKIPNAVTTDRRDAHSMLDRSRLALIGLLLTSFDYYQLITCFSIHILHSSKQAGSPICRGRHPHHCACCRRCGGHWGSLRPKGTPQPFLPLVVSSDDRIWRPTAGRYLAETTNSTYIYTRSSMGHNVSSLRAAASYNKYILLIYKLIVT